MLKRYRLKRRVNKVLKEPMTAEVYARILTGIYMMDYDYILPPEDESAQDVFDTIVTEVAETYDIDRDESLALCGAALVHHRIAEQEFNRLTGGSE